MGLRRRGAAERSACAAGTPDDGREIPVAAVPAVPAVALAVAGPQVEVPEPVGSSARTIGSSARTIGEVITTALELERDRYEIALVHVDSEELVRTGVLVTMRDLEVLGSAAHFYSETYENPERRYPQVLARRERARRIGRALWRFAVDRCGIEEADRVPSRAG